MINPQDAVKIYNLDHQENINVLNKAKGANLEDSQMMEAAKDFEAVFVTKLLNVMDSTVSRDEGFMKQGKTEKTFKSFYHQAIAKEMTRDPETSFGLAKQIYEQMKDMV